MLAQLFSKPILRLSVAILVNENILRILPVLSKDISHRRLGKFAARTPAGLFTTEEMSSRSIDSDEFSKSQYDQSDEKPERKNIKALVKQGHFKQTTMQSSEAKDYEVLDECGSKFSKLVMQSSNRKMRRKNNLMMLEGKRLNMDAIQAGLKPKNVFFTQKALLNDLHLVGSGVPLFKIPYKIVQLWSKLETPPGIVGFYGVPEEGEILTKDTMPVRVLCDNVRDPGNMGAIVRVAASVGCSQLMLTRGCTDPWDSKVLRSASGGHFHVPIKMDMTWEECEQAIPPSETLWLADNNCTGNPGCTISVQSYHSVDFMHVPSVVVIGGETEGLSREVIRLASNHGACRIHIPLSNCMESLNSGCALSVVLFEIKRQILAKDNVTVDQVEGLRCSGS